MGSDVSGYQRQAWALASRLAQVGSAAVAVVLWECWWEDHEDEIQQSPSGPRALRGCRGNPGHVLLCLLSPLPYWQGGSWSWGLVLSCFKTAISGQLNHRNSQVDLCTFALLGEEQNLAEHLISTLPKWKIPLRVKWNVLLKAITSVLI